MAKTDSVLVAIMNDRLDFNLAQDHHWYRIPVSSAEKWLKKSWPPDWLAFYQTKIFANEKYSVRHFAKVKTIRTLRRRELFPDQRSHPKSNWLYHQLWLEPLQTLPQPIFSRRRRRIIFIPTTWEKFVAAAEINDLYNDSPLEDHLWAQFKRLAIPAERQEMVGIGDENFFLDFAIYCAKGKIDVETDGDTWHIGRETAPEDNRRDNLLKASGWEVLRFTTLELKEKMEPYCLDVVAKNIKRFGGLEEGNVLPRQIELDTTKPKQLGLFDGL